MTRLPFAVVVSGPSRLAFAGSAETVEELLRVHSPSSILPGAWTMRPTWAWGGSPASWVVREIATGRAILETYSLRVVERLNTAKYEAVPVLVHLQSINRRNV